MQGLRLPGLTILAISLHKPVTLMTKICRILDSRVSIFQIMDIAASVFLLLLA